MPGFTYLAEKHASSIPAPQRELLWDFGTQDEILRRLKPDAVIFASNWDHFALSAKPNIPLIIDLHGSRLIETSMWDRPVSDEKKVRTLCKADLLMTAGQRQRKYFAGWLVQAGRVPETQDAVAYIPISLAPELPEHEYPSINSDEHPFFVSGGGWFPWQNQSRAIQIVAKQVKSRDQGKLSIYGTPHKGFADSSLQKLINQIYRDIQVLSQECPERIKLSDYIGRSELLSVYRGASVALEAMEYNLERELAFTTRTIEYLWCGLPVLYNNYSEVSEHISEYQAGWTIDPTSSSEIENAIEQIFADPKEIKRRGENAQRLVRERFTWDQTIKPLIDFLREPQVHPETEPSIGAVYRRPSFLTARGDMSPLGLSSRRLSISQGFITPADNLGSIEVPLSLSFPAARQMLKAVRLELRGKGGKALVRRSVPAIELPENGSISLPFPLLRLPHGGDKLSLIMSLELAPNAKAGLELIQTLVLNSSKFPFFSFSESTGSALALSFVPGESTSVYKARVLARRAAVLAKEGEWQRLFHALRRRVPQAVQKVRQRITE